ncbi:Epm2A-Interacting Protein 1 [Manis pentadactyla]|nr:Epm2A-Interacting Protein 1 [Manis pentadactyla]
MEKEPSDEVHFEAGELLWKLHLHRHLPSGNRVKINSFAKKSKTAFSARTFFSLNGLDLKEPVNSEFGKRYLRRRQTLTTAFSLKKDKEINRISMGFDGSKEEPPKEAFIPANKPNAQNGV